MAQAESVHYSNKLENNDLPLLEAERAVRDELAPDARAKIELVNYVRALRRVDELHARDALAYTPAVLLEIHGILTRNLGGTKPGFEPHHEGAWRDGIAVVPDPMTGGVHHEGEPPEHVPAYMEWLCDWLTRNRGRRETYPVPVLAGVAHWAVTWIHPFADGNGRMARLVAGMVLLREGLLSKRIFSFERHYARDKDAYLAALRTVRRHDKDLGPWLEYFLDGLAREYERVADRVVLLAKISGHVKAGTSLNVRQETALTALLTSKQTRFSRAEYARHADVSASTAKEDLSHLAAAGVIRRSGTGRATAYQFARAADGTARRGTWSDARIEAELREFLEGRAKWPSADDWRNHGKRMLYEQASRNGGIRRWRRALGY
jgi:Fic family protein